MRSRRTGHVVARRLNCGVRLGTAKMPRRRIVAVVLASISGACAPNAMSSDQNRTQSPPALLARIERTICYGWCPAYSVEILVDGTARYEGRAYVVTEGMALARLTPEQVEEVRAAFKRAGFRAISEDCCNCRDVTDGPTVFLTLEDGGPRKTIEHYDGCGRAPPELGYLEGEIDRIVNVEQWIGTRDQRRRKLWEAGQWP
jgi:hypothetical protein